MKVKLFLLCLLSLTLSAFGGSCIMRCQWVSYKQGKAAYYDCVLICRDCSGTPDTDIGGDGPGSGDGPKGGTSSTHDKNGDGKADCWLKATNWTNGSYSQLSTNQKIGTDHGGENYIRPDHTGLDIPIPKGTPIRSVQEGTVIESGSTTRMGLYIRINHPDGTQSVYAHLDAQYVDRGDKIDPSTVIGNSGATGEVDGAHLHLTIWAQQTGPLSERDALNAATLYNEGC